jgi:hypothetical protein
LKRNFFFDFFLKTNFESLANRLNSPIMPPPPPAELPLPIIAPTQIRKRKKHDAYHQPDEAELERLRARRRERRRQEGFVDSDEDDVNIVDGDQPGAPRALKLAENEMDNSATRRNSSAARMRQSGEEAVQRILQSVDREAERIQPHRQRVRELHQSTVEAFVSSQRELESVQQTVQAAAASLRASGASTLFDDKTRTLNFRLPPDNFVMMVRVRCSDTFESIVARVCHHRQLPDAHRIIVLIDHIPLPSTAVTVESCGLENDDVVVLKYPPGVVPTTVVVNDAVEKADDNQADDNQADNNDGDDAGAEKSDAEQSAVNEDAAAGDGVKRVAIRVRNRKGVERLYNLAENKPFSVLFAAYCNDIEVPYSTKFEFDGDIVEPDKTPTDLDLEDDDLLTFIA